MNLSGYDYFPLNHPGNLKSLIREPSEHGRNWLQISNIGFPIDVNLNQKNSRFPVPAIQISHALFMVVHTHTHTGVDDENRRAYFGVEMCWRLARHVDIRFCSRAHVWRFATASHRNVGRVDAVGKKTKSSGSTALAWLAHRVEPVQGGGCCPLLNVVSVLLCRRWASNFKILHAYHAQ